MTPEPIIITSNEGSAGTAASGSSLVVGDWTADGVNSEVAPLHVHHEDDEAWHVLSGALRFRFEDRVLVVEAGSTVLVPAGVPHTFGNAGPEQSRYLIILSTKLDELITRLHDADPNDHAAVYRLYESELLE
jgi:uncharacterized RmlC-like cupin family protein